MVLLRRGREPGQYRILSVFVRAVKKIENVEVEPTPQHDGGQAEEDSGFFRGDSVEL